MWKPWPIVSGSEAQAQSTELIPLPGPPRPPGTPLCAAVSLLPPKMSVSMYTVPAGAPQPTDPRSLASINAAAALRNYKLQPRLGASCASTWGGRYREVLGLH